LLLIVLLLAAFAAAQSYTVTDLGPSSSSSSIDAGARAINNPGDVVINNGLSFLWTPTHSSLSLYPLPGGTLTAALGINRYGLVVGESNGPSNYHAVLWTEGEPQDLGTLPGGIFSAANAVNATGEIAGTADTTQSGSEAMVWTQAMGMQGLGFLPGGGFYVRPGLGVSSLVYPLSIMWVPGKAHAAAELYNYVEFRDRIAALRQEAQPKVAAPTQLHRIPADPRRATAQLQRLDKLWQAGRLSEGEYLQQRQTVLDSMTEEQWDQSVTHPVR